MTANQWQSVQYVAIGMCGLIAAAVLVLHDSGGIRLGGLVIGILSGILVYTSILGIRAENEPTGAQDG